ncbi:hypothetical protein AB1E18_011375 [Capra hircus]
MATVQTTWLFSFPFCGINKVNHFFCDSTPVLRLVCADTARFEIYAIIGTILVVMMRCSLILCSYTRIAAAILKIPSAKGKHKAFSTCSSHLLVVSLFYVSLSLTYFQPKSNNSPESKKVLSLSYAVVTPMLNPIIYSLRNNKERDSLPFYHPFLTYWEKTITNRRERVNHFFCDSPPVIALVCADTSLFELEALTATVLFILFPFLLILGSYVRILSTIFRMPSAEGKRKAFSTCSSHLLVVSLFYSTAILTYFRPRSSNSPESKKLLSLSYTVVTPMLNPIIYSLRNSEVKAALRRAIRRTLGFQKL